MPFRVFAAGEVLSAANVNDYLAEQAVSTFASSGARGSAITSPNEGQLSYLSDTNTLEIYNGSAWVNAGSAINAANLTTGTAVTSGQILTADGATGVSFQNNTSGLVHINTTSFSAVSSVSLPASTFTTTYKRYRIYINATASTGCDINFRLRASGTDATGNDYIYQSINGNNTSITGSRTTLTFWYLVGGYVASTGSSNSFFEILNPASAERTQGLIMAAVDGVGTTTMNLNLQSIFHNVASAYDSGTLIATSGNISGTVSVYGFKQ